jgi:hypothetical protein
MSVLEHYLGLGGASVVGIARGSAEISCNLPKVGQWP